MSNSLTKGMNMPVPDRWAFQARQRDLKCYAFEMPTWWGGRLKALHKTSYREVIDAAVVGLFLFAMSLVIVMPIANM